MHSLEPELLALGSEGLVEPTVAAHAIARERRDPLSIHAELRLALYAGVLLVTGGVGTLLARHQDRVGPLAIALLVAAAAIACGVPAVRARRAGRPLGAAADYLLLLAALLLSADLAYAEYEFRWFGAYWSWHLLLLTVAHAAVAYAFGSGLVLGAALGALAGWFGVGLGLDEVPFLGFGAPELGARALACAATIAAWGFVDRRRDAGSRFTDVFVHFAANLAFGGVIAWCARAPWLLAGLPLLVALATASIRHGMRRGREVFVVYGVLYAALGVCVVAVPRIDGSSAAASFMLLVVGGAAFALWSLHQRMRERAP